MIQAGVPRKHFTLGALERFDALMPRGAVQQVIMDVGGGRGELLARCMLYAGHESKGVLFDRQWVLDRCAAVKLRAAATRRHAPHATCAVSTCPGQVPAATAAAGIPSKC
jgi:hypothetical protein